MGPHSYQQLLDLMYFRQLAKETGVSETLVEVLEGRGLETADAMARLPDIEVSCLLRLRYDPVNIKRYDPALKTWTAEGFKEEDERPLTDEEQE